jgi:hypothetical protein
MGVAYCATHLALYRRAALKLLAPPGLRRWRSSGSRAWPPGSTTPTWSTVTLDVNPGSSAEWLCYSRCVKHQRISHAAL